MRFCSLYILQSLGIVTRITIWMSKSSTWLLEWEIELKAENREWVIIINRGHNKSQSLFLSVFIFSLYCASIFGYPFKLHIMPITKLNLLSCITTAKALSHHKRTRYRTYDAMVRATIARYGGKETNQYTYHRYSELTN